jgi:hypothetical protein
MRAAIRQEGFGAVLDHRTPSVLTGSPGARAGKRARLGRIQGHVAGRGPLGGVQPVGWPTGMVGAAGIAGMGTPPGR